MEHCPIKHTTDDPIAVCEDIHGLTWGLFPDKTYACRFGSLAPWRSVPVDDMASSIVDHLEDGGDDDV